MYISMRRLTASLVQILSCVHPSGVKSLQCALPVRVQNFKHMYFISYQEKGSQTSTVLTVSGGTPRKVLSFATLIYVETVLKNYL